MSALLQAPQGPSAGIFAKSLSYSHNRDALPRRKLGRDWLLPIPAGGLTVSPAGD